MKVIKNLNTRSEKKKLPVVLTLIIGSVIHLFLVINIYKFGAIDMQKCRIIGSTSYIVDELMFGILQLSIFCVIIYVVKELHGLR